MANEELEHAFAEAEASLRMEGMQPTLLFYELKARILAGEIDFDRAVEILKTNYPSKIPDADAWEDMRTGDPLSYYRFMESLDPKVRELGDTDREAYYRGLRELETPENFVSLNRLHDAREAGRRLVALAGSAPNMQKIPRRKVYREMTSGSSSGRKP